VSEISPGDGVDIQFGVSTGGLDFMSSSGYPQIEFGYDDATDEDEESDSIDESTDPDQQGANRGGHKMPNLVSIVHLLVHLVALENCLYNQGSLLRCAAKFIHFYGFLIQYITQIMFVLQDIP
jgi:hypothetical protein